MALEGDDVHQLFPDRTPDFLRSEDFPLTLRTASLLAVLFLLVGVAAVFAFINPATLLISLPLGFVVGYLTKGIWHP